MTTGDRLTFRRVPPPTVAALEKLVHLISRRVGRALERQVLLVRDFENSFLTLDPTEIGSMPFSVETNNLISVQLGQTDELAGA